MIVVHQYFGLVSFYNVYHREKKSISVFVRGGKLIENDDWLLIPGFAGNYHFTEHLRGALFFGVRSSNPTVGLGLFISPFSRKTRKTQEQQDETTLNSDF
jgi:hypothetical protein